MISSFFSGVVEKAYGQKQIIKKIINNPDFNNASFNNAIYNNNIDELHRKKLKIVKINNISEKFLK